MKDKIVIDLGQIMDELFEATQSFGDAFKEGFRSQGNGPFTRWDENVDYYPAYTYPPANIYMTTEKSLIFEFALAGFDEKDISLEFRGDYMVLSARVPEARKADEEIKFLKRRLKFKDIAEQKYFAPADKFDRDAVQALFRNGVLTVNIPPKQDTASQAGIKIEIVKEEQ